MLSIFTEVTLLSEENEDILIQGCIEWERTAQNALYRKYSAKMFAVCFKYSSSREEAEDTFHEGFMKVFENIKTFRREGSLEGWIRRIMVNTAIEKYKKNSRLVVLVSIEDHQPELNNYYVDDILSTISAHELMHLIQKLPPQYRMVFNLYEFEGLLHKEIATRLNISEGTSKSNLSRARAILQREVSSKKNRMKEIAHS
jgi:RNA polymerase sigma factor (sigma-70 family)